MNPIPLQPLPPAHTHRYTPIHSITRAHTLTHTHSHASPSGHSNPQPHISIRPLQHPATLLHPATYSHMNIAATHLHRDTQTHTNTTVTYRHLVAQKNPHQRHSHTHSHKPSLSLAPPSHAYLHKVADGLPLGQDLGQVLGAQDVTQGGGRQKLRGTRSVLYVVDGGDGVAGAVVDHGVHRHRHRVPGQYLPDNNTKSLGPDPLSC